MAGSDVILPADSPVVDVDVHIHEDPHELAEYAEGALRHALMAHTQPERWLDTAGYSPLTPYEPPIGDEVGQGPHVIRTVAQLRSDMAQLGTDQVVLFTGRLLGTAAMQDATYPVGISQAYNRYLQARWLNPATGVYGAVMIPPQDPVAAAQEIARYAATPGFAAVYLPMAGVYPLWGHRRYDPIFAAAEAAGLPVVLHGYTIIRPVFPYQLDQFDTALAKQTLAKPLGSIANLVSLVTTGVLARFPQLKFVFAESGLSWLPFVMWRLDQQVQWLRHEVPDYAERPSVYIRRQVYVTTQRFEEPDDPMVLQALITSIGGPERILFASDWPHYDADPISRIQTAPLANAWKRKILSENACAVFKFEI